MPAAAFVDYTQALRHARTIRQTDGVRHVVTAVANVRTVRILDRLEVRIYRPSMDGRLPIVVYLHGGGWVSGSLDTQDDACRRFAVHGQCLVVSVDYRLAPEFPYPAALDDAYDAMVWAREHGASCGGDPRSLAIAGSSAGGTLAAAVALRARDTGAQGPDLQVLAYPPLDSAMASESYRHYSRGHGLTAEMMRWFWRQYAPDLDDHRLPWVSPCYAEALAGLPPAIIEVAERDPLRDEGRSFASRLLISGVDVDFRTRTGFVHGYFGSTPTVSAAAAAVDELAFEVGRRLRLLRASYVEEGLKTSTPRSMGDSAASIPSRE